MDVRLAARDAAALLDAVQTLNEHRDLDDFPRVALAAVRALIPADHYGYNEVNLRTRSMAALVEPTEAALPDITGLARLMPQHPLFAHVRRTGDRSARTIGELIEPRAFHRLAIYEAFFGPGGIEDQLACILPGPPWLTIGLVASRGAPGFSPRDRLILELLRPHLDQAYRACEAFALYQQADLLTGHATILLRGQRVEALSEQANAWLRRYAGWTGDWRALPEPIASWMSATSAQDSPSSRAPLVIARDGVALEIQLVRLPSTAQVLLVLEERLLDLNPAHLADLDLSPREAEVLCLAARRLSNEEIADRLSISPRTVGKHLEHVYDRLGAANRQEAVALAQRRLRSDLGVGRDAPQGRRAGWRESHLTRPVGR